MAIGPPIKHFLVMLSISFVNCFVLTLQYVLEFSKIIYGFTFPKAKSYLSIDPYFISFNWCVNRLQLMGQDPMAKDAAVFI